VYAPANDSDRKIFISHIDTYLHTSMPIILAGDFNCVLNPNIDKVGGNIKKLQVGAKELKQITLDFNLTDVFRKLYPNQVSTTWRIGKYASRLSRF